MQEWIDIQLKALANKKLLTRQMNDHTTWGKRIKTAWARNELSPVEHHTFDQFYFLPPTSITDTLDKTQKPAGSIRAIPSGEYDVTNHRGFGNFCVQNGVLYSTVGTDIFSLNLSTLALTHHPDINEGKEYFQIQWESFPPNLGDEFSWHNVINTMKIHNIYPLQDGSFLIYTGPTLRSDRTLERGSVQTPGQVKIVSSDFSETLHSFPIAGLWSNAVIPIGTYIHFFHVDSQTVDKISKSTQMYTITDFSGEVQSTGRLLPQIDYYGGSKRIELYENINGRLSTTGTRRVWFETVEEYEEWIAHPPDGLYKVTSNLISSPQGSLKPYYIYANFYSYEVLVGDYAPDIAGESQMLPGSYLAARGTQLVAFDPKSHLIRIMNLSGETVRTISFLWCDHFGDAQVNFRPDTSYTQISVDPFHPEYIYILFEGHIGTIPGRLIGRLKIGTDE